MSKKTDSNFLLAIKLFKDQGINEQESIEILKEVFVKAFSRDRRFNIDEPIPESEGGGSEIATQAISQINLSPETETKLKEIGDTYSFAQIAIVGSATLAALLLLVFGGRKSAE